MFFVYLLVAGLMTLACSSSSPSADGGPDNPDFVSDDPDLDDDYYGGGNGGSGGSGTGGGAGSGGSGGEGGAERAIEEADIVQTSGNRLYALSRYGGLSIIDVGTQDELELLGRFKTDATPFEMYLRGNVVLALFDSYGFGDYNSEGVWEWNESSRVLALDVSDATNVRVLSDTKLPGTISDSRIVGDVLYVVSYENGYCWDCSQTPRTTVASFGIANPAQTQQVDRISFDDVQDSWGWSPRSITVTDQRMYVAGRDYDSTWGSKIQIVDISDPTGDMRLGIALRAAGEIESRWQMDESNGVLRVISQPGIWDTSQPPVLQTFQIQSSDAATRLASLDVQLPMPERLRSVRFDGSRAFAITAVQTDPLFTFDLSDPADPKQLGELEIPGWVYHMEPRGDRLLALGFDNANEEGSLHVSIFDVSDLTTPTLLSRVHFGFDWASFAEDQDRIHKAFKLLEPEGLILVPFSGYDYGSSSGYCGSYVSGVQLIDWSTDSLTRRGVVPSVGQARRAFLMNQRLFTVSDDRVESFDYSDRDAPSRTASVSLARRVSKSKVVGDHMLRLGGDWWSDSTILDVVETSKADQAASLGEVLIENELADGGCSYGVGSPKLFTHGNLAYVVYSNYDYYYYDSQLTAVAIVDISNPAEPRLLKQHELKAPGVQYWWTYGLNDVLPTGADSVMVGTTLAVLRSTDTYLSVGSAPLVTLEVADLSDPSNPTSVTIPMSETRGMTGLQVHDGKLYTSHYEPTPDGRVRFYLDQIDISDPANPKFNRRNVPGSLFAIDGNTGKVITATYQRHEERLAGGQTECWQRHGYSYSHFAYEGTDYTGPGTCTWITHELKLLDVSGSTRVESTLALDEDMHPKNSVMGDGVLFAQLRDYIYDQGPESMVELHTLSGFAEGKLKLGKAQAPPTDYYLYISDLAVSGKRAGIVTGQSFFVVDASDPVKPVVSQSQRLVSYPESISMDATHAYVSLGYEGVQSIALE